jgi:uncharacterized protein (TIGR02118 family)
MVKLVFCLRRKPGMSREEFQQYWRDTHAPLVAGHAAALGIKRYVQSHTMTTPVNAALRGSRGGPEEYDGVAELWWDSIDALVAGSSSEAGQAAGAALLDDERKFIDLASSPLFIVDENVVVG